MVRIGEDNTIHGILRWHEQARERGGGSLRHFTGDCPCRTRRAGHGVHRGTHFDEADVQANILRIAELLRRAHRKVGREMRGPVLAFWPFQVNRSYMARLAEEKSRHAGSWRAIRHSTTASMSELGPVDLVFGHNDSASSHLIDDGRRALADRLGLCGVSTAFFDLGGLASNAGFSIEENRRLIDAYFS